jgi:UDP-N-acetylmuramate dehydrogenase
MKIYKNISLKPFNTFGLDCAADNLVILRTEQEASAYFRQDQNEKEQILIIGGGSNILFAGNFTGSAIHPIMRGMRVEKRLNGKVLVSAGAGVMWDSFVDWCVNNEFGGLENLSYIPGSVGASPVQNIGAYGVEVRNYIEKVAAVNTTDGTTRNFNNNDCEFGYRSSIFKNRKKGKYLVTRVFFILDTHPVINISYGALDEEVKHLGAGTIKSVREAVINIRRRKLPDPRTIGNAGSFFKNPIVNEAFAENLRSAYPEIPFYNDLPGLTKLSAGWMIEKCGWKGRRNGDAGVHEKHALVLVNYGKASGMEIFELSEKIRKSVLERFGVDLEREVEVIGVI